MDSVLNQVRFVRKTLDSPYALDSWALCVFVMTTQVLAPVSNSFCTGFL